MMTPEERFAAKVVRVHSGCLLWIGAVADDGYGRFWVAGRTVRPHRWRWEQEHGPLPAHLVTRHVCDEPLCVELTHLVAGDREANAADMVARNRGRGPGRVGRVDPRGPGGRSRAIVRALRSGSLEAFEAAMEAGDPLGGHPQLPFGPYP